MAKSKTANMFAAAQQRQKEQKDIESVMTTDAPVASGTATDAGRMRKRGPDATTMTIAISKADKAMVKTYAAQQSTTVSDLFHNWIIEHCAGGTV